MYNPGTNPILTSKQITLGTVGSRRALGDDEFQYYYNFVLDESANKIIRIAVAVILKADLIRLYENYSEYRNSLLDDLVESYKSLVGQDKALADSEIYAFEQYLVEPVGITTTDEQDLEARQHLFFTHRQSQEKIIERELQSQEVKETANLELDMEKALNIVEKAETRNAWNKFIVQNFSEFLYALYVDHPVLNAMNEYRAKSELKLRKGLFILVNDKKINGSQAIRVYADGLNLLIEAQSDEEASAAIHKLISKYGRSHPLLRMLS